MDRPRRPPDGWPAGLPSLPPTFDARPDARLRLPVAALRQSLAGPTADTNRVAPTNRFLEITGDFLSYRDGWLRSGDRVHVDYFEATNRLGQLDCAALAVKYGQHVEALEASGGVAAEEFPTARGAPGPVARRLHCATATAGFDDTGRLTRLGLDGKVVGEQEETATDRLAIVKRLLCDHVVALMGASNRVERATAVGNVELAQGARSVTADRVELRRRKPIVYLHRPPWVERAGRPEHQCPPPGVRPGLGRLPRGGSKSHRVERLASRGQPDQPPEAKMSVRGHVPTAIMESNPSEPAVACADPTAPVAVHVGERLLTTDKLVKEYHGRRVVNGVSDSRGCR